MNIAHLSTKLALATYALTGTGTLQERLVEAWREGFARLTKKDVPPELTGLYNEVAVEYKRTSKLPDTEDMPQALLQLSDEEATAIIEAIIMLSLECAKLQGMIYTRN